MIVIRTGELTPESIEALPKEHAYWIYNGLDCMLTAEIAEVLLPKVEADADAKRTYQFERALQGPFMEMMLRGFAMDMGWRADLLSELERRATAMEELLNEYAQALWEKGLNAHSPKQLMALFYDYMKLPVQFVRKKGVKSPTTNDDAIEALMAYFNAKPLCQCIMKIRRLWKLHGALNSGVDNDNRMRASFNIAGTETGRASSNKNAFGTGTNFQNITADIRRAFIPTRGYKMGGFDLAQAESRLAGLSAWLASGKDAYLLACESGDLHTAVTKMVRPNLQWTGSAKGDKAVADTKVPGDPSGKTFRDYSKNIGHGTNYLSKGFTLHQITGIPLKEIQTFQEKYFESFPEIPEWHQSVATSLQQNSYLVTVFGRKRYFFERLGDDSTVRKGVAFGPQSAIAEYINLGIYLCWSSARLRTLGFRIIAQVHDALYFEYPPEVEKEVLDLVAAFLSPKLRVGGRLFSIPCDAKVGWNWGPVQYDKKKDEVINPYGLKAWNGIADNRVYTAKEQTGFNLLDRRVR